MVLLVDFIFMVSKFQRYILDCKYFEHTTFSDYGDQSVMGGTVGLGVTLQSPWGIFLKAEATRTDYQSIQLISTSGNLVSLEHKPIRDAAYFTGPGLVSQNKASCMGIRRS